MKNLKVSQVYEDTAKMVRFRLNDGWDYVWITYHDLKGFLTITSSFGNWAYIWSAMGHEGTTLTSFIGKAGDDYLANKMWGKDQEMFEYDEAVKDIHRQIIEDRRMNLIDSDKARLLWKEAEDLGEDYEGASRDMFMSAFSDNRILTDWKCEWWETNWGMREKPAYLTLKNEIIPMIRKYMKGELKNEVAESAPPQI